MRWNCLLLILQIALTGSAKNFFLLETNIPIVQVDLSSAKYWDPKGYPRLDWSKINLNKIITQQHQAVILENAYLRVTLLPKMGRVFSLVNKISRHEQLWTNQIARPISANNDPGWWMVWGGIEYTLPRGEHGTSWSLDWDYRISENSSRRKAVKMSVLEPLAQIKQSLEIALDAEHAYFEAQIHLLNTSNQPVRFAHWVNPMWAPGGRGELSPETEFIVPCARVKVLERDFNNWMLGERVQPYEANPLRFAKNWRSIGDLLCDRLDEGFYSAFSHETNEGIARIFNPRVTPGMDIWTWGFPPPPDRQREYSLAPNLGYVEMWGGTARDFSDDALGTLAPKQELRWTEWMYAYHGTGGLTFANQDYAIRLEYDPPSGAVQLGICPTHPIKGLQAILHMEGRILLRDKFKIAPDHPFYRRLKLPPRPEPSATVPELILRKGGNNLLHLPAQVSRPLQWDSPYMRKD